MNVYLDKTLRFIERKCDTSGGVAKGSARIIPTEATCASLEEVKCLCGGQALCRYCYGAGKRIEGYIHASVIQALGQEAAWQAIQDNGAVTAQINTNFVSFGTLVDGEIEAIGDIIHIGRKLFVSEAKVWQNGRLLANVIVTFARTKAS